MRCAICLAVVLVPIGAGAADLRDLLKLPVSPGGVALLVEHAKEPQVVERWRVALTDKNPQVRGAAARVANVTQTTSLLPTLVATLATEANQSAGIEQIRAVVMMRGAATDAQLFDAAKRLGSRATRVLAETLAVVRGPNVFDTLDLPAADREALRPRARAATRTYAPAPGATAVRSLGDVPPGVYSDALNAARCSTSSDRAAIGANVVYDALGRPQAVEILNQSLPRGCIDAFRTLFLTAFDRPGDSFEKSATVSAAASQVVLAFKTPDFVQCMDVEKSENVSQTTPRTPGAGVVTPPKKTRDIPARYPPQAMRTKATGVVIVEMIISSTGCVQFMQALKNPDSSLSVAALEAVSGWQFTPTLLDGVPQTILYTATVSFNLR